MAMIANGVRLEQCGYEFAVVLDGLVIECQDYDHAKRLSEQNDLPLKMRILYRTDWQDAK